MILERTKFQKILKIIRAHGYKVIVRRRNRRLQRAQVFGRIRGSTNGRWIYIGIGKRMSEMDWSDAAATLIHEFGHCGPGDYGKGPYNFTKSEKAAWRRGIKWINTMPAYCPRMLDFVRDLCLETYGLRVNPDWVALDPRNFKG